MGRESKTSRERERERAGHGRAWRHHTERHAQDSSIRYDDDDDDYAAKE
jgi:hypothetical protein